MYLPYKDDKPERAAKIRSEACSDNFRHPKLNEYLAGRLCLVGTLKRKERGGSVATAIAVIGLAHQPECLPPRHNDKSGTLGKMEVSPFFKFPRKSFLRFFGAEFYKKHSRRFSTKTWEIAFSDEKDIYLNKYF